MEAFRETVTHDPFSDVFAATLAAMTLPGASAFFSDETLTFVGAHPEMRAWLHDDDARRLQEVAPRLVELREAVHDAGAFAAGSTIHDGRHSADRQLLLYFAPLPQGHGSFRPTFGVARWIVRARRAGGVGGFGGCGFSTTALNIW